jgi:FdhD protein
MMPGNRRAHSAYAVAIGTGRHALCRQLPEETAVALSYNGATQAVMMATPADLEDFALGFSLTEGLASPTEIDRVEHVETPEGIDLRIWLHSEAGARVAERRRSMTGPVGCGLCGIDSLAEAMRPPGVLPETGLRLGVAQVLEAVAALPQKQPLHDATRAVHAAGFFVPGQGLVAVREDVGRHNALDKLAGALLRADQPAGQGAVVLTSRVSIDMVQKCVRLGAPVLIAVSAPTASALDLADRAGLCVVALARPERFEIFTHPHRITDPEGAADVA